jgi:two-component sensor histidine kinase
MPRRSDGTVVVYAPFSRDSESIVGLLAPHKVSTHTVGSLAALVDRLGEDVGAVLMSEEALVQPNWRRLADAINEQPSWSSYPFILLVGQKRFGNPETIYNVLPAEMTNVIILERPMGSATLLSAVRWALAGRRRQLLSRDHLQRLEESARQQAVLIRELAHRVKNTIAVLQSIVTQTLKARSDVDDLRETILARFAALARAHDLLLGTDFAAADFGELVRRSLEVYGDRFIASGPPIDLSPQASLSFALVLHELGKNAAKYGSLRSHRGLVDVSWNVSGKTFAFQWQERGVPGVKRPTRSGFGSRLIRSTLEGLGTVNLSYEPPGFHLSLSADLDRLRYGVPDGEGLASHA